MSDRDELAKRIVGIAKGSLARYAEEFPERAGDARNADYISWVYRAIEKILKALDDYDITVRKLRDK